MPNFGAKILNNASSSLAAQQAVLATIGNNIANVNTQGYARRVLDLQTRVSASSTGGLNIGNGVEVGSLLRIADQYIQGALQQATGTNGRNAVENEYLKRLEGFFSLTGDKPTIGSAITQFYNAVNDLTADPASIELRTNVVERAQDLVTTIRNTFNGIASLQSEADTRVANELEVVNSLTAKVAELNGLISRQETLGITAADERDQRDTLLKQLSEKISFSQVEAPDGSVTLSLSNGFALVNGTTTRSLDFTNNPSFVAGNGPRMLDGGTMRYVVYDYDSGPGTAHIDLTQVLKNGEGTIAGLLRIRGTNSDPATDNSAFAADGIMVEMGSRVEAITRNLLTSINLTYLGPDENGGVAGYQPSSGDLNGNVPAVYGLFDFQYAAGAHDVNGDGQPNDLTDPALVAAGLDNFSSILQLSFTDPRRFAAALDSDAAAGATSFQSGDGRNAQALAATQATAVAFGVGSYAFTGTYDEIYNETVTHVGNAKSRSDVNLSVAESSLLTAQSKRDSFSGVSLDEEFSKLVTFQRAYQASARMIRVADELLEQIVGLI